MNFTKTERQEKILKLFNDVEKSGLTVKEYFKSQHAPIGIAQYFRLKKELCQARRRRLGRPTPCWKCPGDDCRTNRINPRHIIL